MAAVCGRGRGQDEHKAVYVAYALDASGDVSALLGRLAAARAETNRTLDAVPPAAMTRPTPWVNWQIDVRFRLHRFASHLVEHTIQSEKILIALGWARPKAGGSGGGSPPHSPSSRRSARRPPCAI